MAPFDVESFKEIISPDANVLTDFVEFSLVEHNSVSGRFWMHDVIRKFAASLDLPNQNRSKRNFIEHYSIRFQIAAGNLAGDAMNLFTRDSSNISHAIELSVIDHDAQPI